MTILERVAGPMVERILWGGDSSVRIQEHSFADQMVFVVTSGQCQSRSVSVTLLRSSDFQ